MIACNASWSVVRRSEDQGRSNLSSDSDNVRTPYNGSHAVSAFDTVSVNVERILSIVEKIADGQNPTMPAVGSIARLNAYSLLYRLRWDDDKTKSLVEIERELYEILGIRRHQARA